MSRLSDAQLEALGLLKELPRSTARWTTISLINGNVAKSLVAAGLARYTRGWQVGISGDTLVAITDAGVSAYNEAMKP